MDVSLVLEPWEWPRHLAGTDRFLPYRCYEIENGFVTSEVRTTEFHSVVHPRRTRVSGVHSHHDGILGDSIY